MSTKTDWIKMTDRRPTEADFPVWVYDANSVNRGPFIMFHSDALSWAYWRPAKDDMPEPPREETQEEGDYAALVEWGRDENIQPLFTVRKTWHAALAWERAEVAAMLTNEHSDLYDKVSLVDILEAIRARCAGGGK